MTVCSPRLHQQSRPTLCSFCTRYATDLSAWRMQMRSSSHGHIGMIASMLRQSWQWPLPANLKRCRFTRHCSAVSSLRTQHEGVLDAMETRYSPDWLLQRPRPQVTAWHSVDSHAHGTAPTQPATRYFTATFHCMLCRSHASQCLLQNSRASVSSGTICCIPLRAAKCANLMRCGQNC